MKTHRILFLAAVATFVVVGLLPIAAMLARVEFADLSGLFDARTSSLLLRTAWMGCGAAALACAIGLPFGFLTARTDLPLAGALRLAGFVPLLVPPIILAMTLSVLLIELRGAPATILVLGLSSFPIVAAFVARACERIDARREEAAFLAGGLGAVLRMELPLVAPAAACGACFAFVLAINDFAVPDYIASVGTKYNVYADEVFASWQSVHAPGKAVAAALPLIVLSFLALLPALRLRRRAALITLDGDFQRPARLRLGAWRWPAFVASAALIGFAVLVPIGRLFFEAGGGARGWSFPHLLSAFGRALETGQADLQRSLLFATGAAAACLLPALLLGHFLERSRGSGWLETVAVLPLAVPAILFGIGTIVVWNNEWTAAFYGSGGMVVVLLLGRFLAFPILSVSGATAALDPRLEEAAQIAGASRTQRLFSIVAPIVGPGWLGGAALVFVFGMRELDAAILVPAANGTAMFRVYNAIHFGRDDFVAALALLVVLFILLPGMLWAAFARERMEVLP